MKSFTQHRGAVAPLDRANVDTDAIIPKQFLKSIKRSGFGVNLFDAWRYLDRGEPGQDVSQRPRNPDFVLNQPHYQNASVLLARKNFGCGSSREHAVWALDDAGFRSVIAPSFADIFYNNSLKNGLLPVALPEETVNMLWDLIEEDPETEIAIDLESQQVTLPDGQQLSFEIAPFRKMCLLEGMDDLGYLLSKDEAINTHETVPAYG